MSRKIIFLINPFAGTSGKKSVKDMIATKCAGYATEFELMPTVASGDYDFVRQKITEENFTEVVVCGGDGTVNHVVKALAKTNVNFGIIPLGSGNGLALAAGIPRNVRAALDIIFTGRARRVDGFTVNNEFACMLCGLGFDAKIAHEFAEHPRRGLATYASLITKNFFTARAYWFSIHANGLHFDSNAFFISVANSNQFGHNFTIAPQAALSDGLLDIVVVKKTARPLLLLNVMKQVFAGQLKKIENSLRLPVIYFQTKELIIYNRESAPMHIDGEPRDTVPELSIAVLPGYFNLIHAS